MVASHEARWPRSALRQIFTAQQGMLPALDGLRSLAVLLVICDHWAFGWRQHMPENASPALFRIPIFQWGWTGVDLFFVLSGFLIGRQLWKELYATDTIRLRDFVIRRGLRIWPLYFATLITLWLFSTAFRPSWSDWVMLSNYWHSHYARSWSLSTEEQFYLLMPVLLLLFRRTMRPKWWPLCIVALLATVPAVRHVTYASYAAQGIDPAHIMGFLMYTPFHLHCEPLLAGLLVAWISVRRPAWLAPAPTRAPAWRVLAIAIGVVATGLVLRALNREAFNYVALACLYGAALCVALVDRSIVTAVLRWRPWFVIARLSFGMYLNHLLMEDVTKQTISTAVSLFPGQPSLASLTGLLVTVLLSAGMAAVSYVAIEYPGLHIRDRLLHPGVAGHTPTFPPAVSPPAP